LGFSHSPLKESHINSAEAWEGQKISLTSAID
jgi:hypothetical protein